MEEEHKTMGIIGLIALRKSELYYKVVNELSQEKQLFENDKEKIKKQISEMYNERFLSKEEKQSKKVNPKLNLKDSDLNIKDVIKEIKL